VSPASAPEVEASATGLPVEESSVALASSANEIPPSSPGGSMPTVESSATKPSLKCVTAPLATSPSVVVATVSKPLPPSFDQTMIGCPTPAVVNVRCTVTGIWKTRPSGPNL
jgi:hypothetical protein